MKFTFPKSFYVKLLFIICICSATYVRNQSYIQATLANPSLSFSQSIHQILQEMIHENPQINESSDDLDMVETVQPGNKTPYTISDQVKNSDSYIQASKIAEEFNRQVNQDQLNEYFVKGANQFRQPLDWPSLNIGVHLAQGAEKRVMELSKFHYLANKTLEGADFRSLFPEIENSSQRLGENLYELFISAGDIHLSTWHNEEILADYLLKIFADSIVSPHNDVYQSQYLNIRAEATDYGIDKTPYIRLVVSIVMDVQG